MWRSVSFFKTPFLRQSQVFALLPSLVCLIILICTFFYRSKGRHYSCIMGLDIPKPCSLSPEIFNHMYAYIYLFHLFCYLFTYFVSLFLNYSCISPQAQCQLSKTLRWFSFIYLFIYLFKKTMLKTQNVSSHQLNLKNDHAFQF